MSTDSDQTETAPRKFKLGPLGSLNQVTKGLAKTIRAMADGTLDSQVGARICNGLGRPAPMKMRASRIERMLEKVEATLVPPKRKWLQAIVHEGDDEAEAMEKALAEHLRGETHHIISMRKCNDRERTRFQEAIHKAGERDGDLMVQEVGHAKLREAST